MVETAKTSAPSSTTLLDVLFILFRQKRRIAAFFLTVFVAVFLGTMLAPARYESGAKVLVKLGRESVSADPVLSASVEPIISVGQSREAEIQSEIAILRSKEIAEEIVRRFGPEAILDPDASDGKHHEEGILSALARGLSIAFGNFSDQNVTDRDSLAERKLTERAVDQFLRNLDVDVASRSNIITINYEAFSPDLAQRILTTLLDLFQDKHIQVHRSSESLAFFQQQQDDLRRLVEDYEERLKQLKMRAGTGSLKEEQTILMNRMSQLVTEIERTENVLASSEARILAFERTVKELPEQVMSQETTGVANQAADKIVERLVELRLQEQKLLARYQEDAVPVLTVRQEIAEAEGLLQREKRTLTQSTTALNTVRQQIASSLHTEDANRKAASATLSTLKGQLEAAREDLSRLIALENEIAGLEREFKIHQTNYFKYAEKTEQARINRALETERISNISIVQAPTIPIKHSRPKRGLNILLGFALGLFGSLGLAFALEYLDQTFKRPEEVEDMLGLPVFTSIPLVPQRKDMPPPAIRIHETPDGWRVPDAVSDHFKTLRDGLCFSGLCADKHVSLVVTSCHQGEGVSSVALNLAHMLTVGGTDRALVVDANFKNPDLHREVGRELTPGFTDLLLHDGDPMSYVAPTPLSGVDIVPAGSFGADLTQLTESRLIESVHFGGAMECWLGHYRYVIFDAAPAGANSSTLGLASRVDAVLWVIRAETVRRQVCGYVRDLFEQVKAPVIGCVFNGRRFYVPKWLYRRI